jgi:lipase ATG15
MKPSYSRCKSSQRVTALSLLSFLAPTIHVAAWDSPFQAPAIEPWIPAPIPAQPDTHEFSLRHIYHRGTYQDPDLHVKADVHPTSQSALPFAKISARSRNTPIERLADRSPARIEQHLYEARMSGEPAVLDVSDWTLDDVSAPDVTSKDTIINLAIMAADAYVPEPNQGEWENVTDNFQNHTSFGWQGDGLRGYIFADQNNETIVISLKGTSPAVFDGDGTTTRDKLNDNLFFSCCCGAGGSYFWRQVCDCYSSTYTCNQTCLEKSLRRENRYYRASIDLYTNVTQLYPDSNVWVVGHSLGGAVSSLLGMTFGLPVVTFEAPGDDLAAKRLGLPRPPTGDPSKAYRRKYTGSVHVGHTADPVFMGTCNGATATCTLGGYAMESQCHTGLQCVYDTVTDLNWRVGIGNHKIHNVIDNVFRKYDKVPKCVPDDECRDCYNWKYFKSNGSEPSTTTTSHTTTTTSNTRTRTSTCKTPGWWGCLDETTTTQPVVTTTYTTTTCISPGWFGCKEEANTTITTTTIPATDVTTTTSTTSEPSTSCSHPGWFGCKDPEPTSTSSTAKQTDGPGACKTPGFFFGCRDRDHGHHGHHTTSDAHITPAPTSTATATSATSTSSKWKCKHPAFFGLICLDDDARENSHSIAAATGLADEEEWNSEL